MFRHFGTVPFISECSTFTDEGHSPETSEHLLRFWHFHFINHFFYCRNKCHAAYEAFLASYICNINVNR